MRVSTTVLKGALIDCGRVLDKRITIPALTCVRLDATRAGLKLSVTDLEVSRIQMIETDEPAEAEWSAAVPWKSLKAAMPKKASAAPFVEIDYGVDRMLLIRPVSVSGSDAGGFAALPTHPVEEWPTLPSLDESEPTAVIAGESLHDLFSKTVKAISSEDSRFQLCGALLELNGKARAVATDGHRLHCADTELEVTLMDDPCGEPAAADMNRLIPRRMITAILQDRAFKRAGRGKRASFPRSHVQFSEDHCQVESSRGVRYVSRVLEGTFPDYERVIGKGAAPCRISAPALSFLAALDGAETVLDKLRAVRLDLDPEYGSVRFVANHPDNGRSEAPIIGASLWGAMEAVRPSKAKTCADGTMLPAGEATPPATEIGLNPDYLRDLVTLADPAGRVNIHLKDENSQIWVTLDSDPSFRSVVMPIRL